MGVIIKWVLFSVFLFAGVNWFVRPNFALAAHHLPELSIYSSAGIAGLLCIGLVIFGKH